MKFGSDSERFVLCSEHIVLECGCGEKLVLIGREDDWYAEGRTVFECECGKMLTLANRFEQEEPPAIAEGFDDETLSVRELLRELKAQNRQ